MKISNGFTLIELVMVIVILGILSAVAMPKFINLSRDAKIATLKAARGAVISAKEIVHAKALIENKTHLASSSIDMEGTTINIAYGYPIIGPNNTVGIKDAAGLDPLNFITMGFGNGTYGIVLAQGDRYSTTCGFRYFNATAAQAATVGPLPRKRFLCK